MYVRGLSVTYSAKYIFRRLLFQLCTNAASSSCNAEAVLPLLSRRRQRIYRSPVSLRREIKETFSVLIRRSDKEQVPLRVIAPHHLTFSVFEGRVEAVMRS